MAKLNKYFKVVDDNYGQHGTHIEAIELTSKEFKVLQNEWRKGYALFDSYTQALIYTQD